MNILFDTSFLIEIDRKNEEAIRLAKYLIQQDFHFWISTITVTEVLTGAYLRKDYAKAKERAFSALNQFNWSGFNGPIATKTAEILAYLISKGKTIGFQDAAIAATALEVGAEYMVTENKKHFVEIPALQNRVYTLKELKEKLK